MSKYQINWSNHPDLLDWKNVADEKHRFYYEYIGRTKWDIYEPKDLKHLKLKIGYALYGPPLNVKEKDFDELYKEPSQNLSINYIVTGIKKLSRNDILYVGLTYFIAMSGNKYTEFPTFRVLNPKSTEMDHCFFVDSLGYTYKSWEKLLHTNVMPSCIYCYPKSGFYTFDNDGELELEYSYSPRSFSIFLKGYNIMSAVGNAVTGVLPTGVPETSNSKPIPAECVIRGVSGNAQNSWLIVGSFHNCSSLYAIHSTYSFIKRSIDFKRINPFVADILKKGPMKTNWFAVLNMMPEILKCTNRIRYTHVAQLYASILFFCHTIVCFDVLKQMLKETLKILKTIKNFNLNKRQRYFLTEFRAKIGEKDHEEEVRIIKVIKARDQLLDEIMKIQKNTDENGNYTSGNALEHLKEDMNTNDKQLVLTYYCHFLEEVAKDCFMCSLKIKDAKKKVHCQDEIAVNLKEINNQVQELELYNLESKAYDYLSNSEYGSLEDTIKIDNLKNRTDDNDEDCIQPGMSREFFEGNLDDLTPLEYYNQFVGKSINNLKPKELYEKQSGRKRTWYFELPEEKFEIKLVKIKVISLKHKKSIHIEYY